MPDTQTFTEPETDSVSPEPITKDPVGDVPPGGEFLDRTDEVAESEPDWGRDRRMPGIDVNPGSERQDQGLKERPGKLPGEKGSGADTPGHG